MVIGCTNYLYRFCFPEFGDALKFFHECKHISEVPDYGWVAARPEGRLLLPKELIKYNLTPEQIESDYNHKPIDWLIENNFYTAKRFNDWMCEHKIHLDDGALTFYHQLLANEYSASSQSS